MMVTYSFMSDLKTCTYRTIEKHIISTEKDKITNYAGLLKVQYCRYILFMEKVCIFNFFLFDWGLTLL